MMLITITFIVVISSVCNGLKTSRKDGDVIQRDFPISLPNTGFVSAKSSLDTVMLKIIRKVNSPGFCSLIEIINQPNPNSSPFVGGSEFSIITDQLFNEHYAWSNGVETLSYIPVEGRDYGNWLIGNTPGVDNGYVYISTNMPSLTPINLENDDNIEYQWKWLLNMSWKEQPNMRAICKDIYKPGNIYYEIEYFDHITRQAVKSAFVPDLNPIILSLHNQLNHRFDPIKFLSKESNILIPFPSYFEKSTHTWKLLDGITIIAEYGSPILITRKKEQTGIKESHIGILVNEEHSGKFGWRLSFRNYPFSHMRNKEKETILKTKTTQTLVFEQLNITNIEYKPFKSTLQSNELNSLTSSSILLQQQSQLQQPQLQLQQQQESIEYLFEEEEEYTVEIDNNGCLDDYQLLPLPNTIKKNVYRSIQYSLDTIRPGEYMWLWYTSMHPEPGNSSSSDIIIDKDGNIHTTTDSTGSSSNTLNLTERSKYYNNWQTNEVSELLVRCKSRNNNTLIFQYFLTDRRDVMKQTQLNRDIDYFIIQLPTTTTTTGTSNTNTISIYKQPIAQFQNTFVQIKSLIVLGSDIINYLRRFLLYKEGRIHGLSSCYMYHAAVSMPQALIYAAEILCVLLGSKPVAMVSTFFLYFYYYCCCYYYCYCYFTVVSVYIYIYIIAFL